MNSSLQDESLIRAKPTSVQKGIKFLEGRRVSDHLTSVDGNKTTLRVSLVDTGLELPKGFLI